MVQGSLLKGALPAQALALLCAARSGCGEALPPSGFDPQYESAKWELPTGSGPVSLQPSSPRPLVSAPPCEDYAPPGQRSLRGGQLLRPRASI